MLKQAQEGTTSTRRVPRQMITVMSVTWTTKCATYINHRQGTQMTSVDTIIGHLQLLVPTPQWNQEQTFLHAIKLQCLHFTFATSRTRKMKTSTSPSWLSSARGCLHSMMEEAKVTYVMKSIRAPLSTTP